MYGLCCALFVLSAGCTSPNAFGSEPQSAQGSSTYTVPARLRVSGGVQQARLTKRVEPEYPAKARIQGTIVLRVIIAANGSVKSVASMRGDPRLIPGAIHAVLQWKYKPFYLQGKPVEVETQITLHLAPLPEPSCCERGCAVLDLFQLQRIQFRPLAKGEHYAFWLQEIHPAWQRG